MKKFIFTLIVSFICSITYSQSGWYQVYTPPANKSIHSIQFTSENTGYASLYVSSGTGYGGLLKTTNGGVNWENLTPTGDVGDFCFLDNNTGYIDFFTNTDHILKTTNGGINWVDQGILDQLLGIEFFDYNTGFVTTTQGFGKKTTNGGINWVQFIGGGWYQRITMSCLSADIWIVGDYNINKTTNGGLNWNTTHSLSGSAIYFINNTTGFSGNDFGEILKTTNSGDNWFALDTIVSSPATKNMIFVNENTGYLSADYNQVFKTTDGGHNWSQQVINSSISIEYVHFINPNTGYAGGSNGAIYKTTTGGTVFVNNISTEIPSKYSLGQNYPNPFNSTSNLKFEIAKLGHVMITIYDVSGREVETLVNERLQPGTYSTQWNAANYTSGVYFYKMQTESFTETKRMILIK